MYIKKYRSTFSDIENNLFEVAFYIFDEKAIVEEWIDLGDGTWFNTKTGEIVNEKPSEIEDNSNVVDLLLEGTPVEINYTMGNEAFKPLRCSGASIKLLLKEPIFELYQGEITKVMVKVFKNGNIYWSGFVTPCVYSSPYSKIYDEITIEAIDRISALQYVQYTGSKSIITAYDLLKYCITEINADGFFKNIHIQKKLKIDGSTDILNKLFLQGQNFYDEEEESLKCDLILEHLMTYLGYTMIQWENNIYILDMDDLYNKNSIDFLVYPLDIYNNSTPTEKTINFNTVTLNDTVDCGEDTCNIQLDEVYNKVTVVDNLLEYNGMIEDFKNYKINWVQYNKDGEFSDLYVRTKSKPDDDDDTGYTEDRYIVYNAFYKIGDSSPTKEYPDNDKLALNLTPANVSIRNTKRLNKDEQKLNNGTFFQVSYKELQTGAERESNPRITTAITLVNDIDNGYYSDNIQHWVDANNVSTRNRRIDFFNRKTAFYNAGNCFVLNFDYKLSNQPNYEYANHFYDIKRGSNDPVHNWSDGVNTTTYYNNTDVTCADGSTLVVMNCILKVGKYYYKRVYEGQKEDSWNGLDWINSWQIYSNKERGINDFKYKEEWTTGYSTFDVITILKSGDNFNNLSLTNEVSFTYNNSTESGALINLPNFNIDGEIEFAINEILNLHTFTRTSAEATLGNALDGSFPWPVTYHGGGWTYYYTSRLTAMDGSVTNNSIPISDILFNSFHLTNISLKYVIPDKESLQLSVDESDVRYTNVINEKYVKEATDIDLYINTYDFNHSSYSFALVKNGDKYDYLREVDDGVDNKIQEHRIIERFVKHYSDPKCCYSNTLVNKDFSPFTKIHIKSLNKTFLLTDIDYQLRLNKININSTEY